MLGTKVRKRKDYVPRKEFELAFDWQMQKYPKLKEENPTLTARGLIFHKFETNTLWTLCEKRQIWEIKV